MRLQDGKVSPESEFPVKRRPGSVSSMRAEPFMPMITRRTLLAGTAATLAAVASGPARAAAAVSGVVELFTSQGCSSCPPADAALAEFAADPDVLALGYHVDYWDYLGWADTLASPDNTARQRAYATTLGSRSVYTPQAVVNGRDHLNGGYKTRIRGLIADHEAAGNGLVVPVMVAMSAGRLSVGVGDGIKPAGADMLLTIVYYRDRSEVEIARGENAGRTMVYANAVMAQQTLGMWDGKAMQIDLPRDKIAQNKATGCAVLLQAAIDGAPGPIMGAAKLKGFDRS